MPKPSNSRRRSTDLIKSDTRPINEARIICNQFSRQEGSCTARDRQLRSVHHHHHRLSTPRIRSDKIGSPIRNSKLVLISGPSRPMSGLRLREAKNQRIGSSCDVKQHVFFDGRVPTWAPFNGSRFDSTLPPSLRASNCPLSNRFQHGGTPLDEESRTLFTPFFFFISNTLSFVCRDLEKNICCFCNRKVYVFEGKIFEIIVRNWRRGYRSGLRNIVLRNRAEKSSAAPAPLRPTALRMHHRTGEGQRMQLG